MLEIKFHEDEDFGLQYKIWDDCEIIEEFATEEQAAERLGDLVQELIESRWGYEFDDDDPDMDDIVEWEALHESLSNAALNTSTLFDSMF